MGFVVTIFLTVLFALFVSRLSSLFARLAATLLAGFLFAYLVYWVPFYFFSNDQAASWQWLLIHGYFAVGGTVGVIACLLIHFIQAAGKRSNAN